jgi:ubiquitin-conjugating enzyme E2 S
MSLYPQSQPSLNARMIKILWRQQQELLKKSPDHVKPIINNEDPIDIQADIEGPEGTPYESGIFRVKLFIPSEFPQIAPKGIFLTKIFHPNVSEKGEICVNTLKRDWNPKQWSLYNLFEVIKCLLIVPFPQSSLNEEAGKMFMDNYDEYFKVAKMLTGIHAKKKIVQKIDNDDDKDNSNNNINIKNKDNNEENCDNEDNDDIQMKINNLSEKKDKLIMKEKKGENIINEIDIIEEKDNMNISFLNDNSNSNSFFTNNDNNIFNNFDNPNFLDNIAITRSKTIKFCDRPKFSFLSQQDSNITSQIFHNNINQFSRMNSISSISSVTNYSNITSDIKKVSTFKEKPKLGSLPLLHMNSQKIKNKNNPYGFFRCKTLNLTKNESKKNNKDEINKWLMRI